MFFMLHGYTFRVESIIESIYYMFDIFFTEIAEISILEIYSLIYLFNVQFLFSIKFPS